MLKYTLLFRAEKSNTLLIHQLMNVMFINNITGETCILSIPYNQYDLYKVNAINFSDQVKARLTEDWLEYDCNFEDFNSCITFIDLLKNYCVSIEQGYVFENSKLKNLNIEDILSSFKEENYNIFNLK